MKKTELKNKITELICKPQLASVGTIMDGKPWIRYMILMGEPDLTLFTTTFSSARKVEQIKKDPNVHIVIGGDQEHFKNPHINIQATAHVLTDLETKKKHWCEHLKIFFSGPEDTNFSVIKISPQLIEYTCGDALTPEVYIVE